MVAVVQFVQSWILLRWLRLAKPPRTLLSRIFLSGRYGTRLNPVTLSDMSFHNNILLLFLSVAALLLTMISPLRTSLSLLVIKFLTVFLLRVGTNTSTPHSTICPPGSYCPLGSAFPTPCPSGTFNSAKGSGSIAACLSCTPGSYCQGTGNSQPTGQCSGGYYCSGGMEWISSNETDEVPHKGCNELYFQCYCIVSTNFQHMYYVPT